MSVEKTFKTHDELIDLLESRGIDFSRKNSKSDAKKHLQREGYYNLINGYQEMFLSSKDQFVEGATVDEMFALYEFDRSLREVLFKAILSVETNAKSLIAYVFSKYHGHKNYLIHSNFTNTSSRSIKQVSELIADIQRQIANRSNDPSIHHYLGTHGYIPLWVLNNILTMGIVSKFFSLMKQPEKQEIAKKLKLDEKDLESFLFYLSKVRNFCAHGNRIYCYRSQTPVADTALHQNLGISTTATGEYLNGKRDLFAVLIILRYILSQRDFNDLCKEIEKGINKLTPQLHVLSPEKVFARMGFPLNWKNIKNVSKSNK